MRIEQIHRPGVIPAIVTLFASLVLTIGVMAYWTSDQIARSQHRWCATLQLTLTVAPAPPKPPTDPGIIPSSAFGKATAEYNRKLTVYNAKRAQISAEEIRELSNLARQYHCDLNR